MIIAIEPQWQYVVAGVAFYVLAKVTYKICYPFTSIKTKDTLKIGDGPPDSEDEFEINPTAGLNELSDGSKSLTKQTVLIFDRLDDAEVIQRSNDFMKLMEERTSVRSFSSEPVPEMVVRNIVKAAASVPSYNHSEPWTFVSVTSATVRERLRLLIESCQKDNFTQLDLAFTSKEETKAELVKSVFLREYLTSAPCILLVFKRTVRHTQKGVQINNFLADESLGVAIGVLLAAIQYSGLVTLVTVCQDLNYPVMQLLDRPSTEKLMYLLPIGFPSNTCVVPNMKRKSVQDVLVEL